MARKSKTQRAVEACPLFDWEGPGFCCGCNKDLGKPNRRWCSQKCTDGFLRQHSWQDARAAAVKRDGGCVKCGRDGTVPDEVKGFIEWMRRILNHHPDRWAFREWHREALQENPERFRYMTWQTAEKKRRREFRKETGIEFEEMKAEFERLAGRAIRDYKLEVNHITPVKGRHADYGCLHHLDGLETLCGEHHLEITRQQHRDGLLK